MKRWAPRFVRVFCVFAFSAPGIAESPLLTDALVESSRRGLTFLAQHQNRDGSFGVDSRDRDPHLGVSALVGLSLLSGGHLPARGDHGELGSRLLEYVLSSGDEKSGLLANDRTLNQPMYGHAFATLYLAQVYGNDRRPPLARPLRRAVDLIVASQSPQGGWRYFPGSTDADLSVTACQISALRAARNVGIPIPAETLSRATGFVLACRNGNGSFRYQVEFGHASFPLTAAGLTSLYQLGRRRENELDPGFRWLSDYFPEGDKPVRGHFLYGQLYALQAAYQRNDGTFDRWYLRLRDRLLEDQLANGSFKSPAIGDLYGTAMSLLLLQLPYHFSPLLLR